MMRRIEPLSPHGFPCAGEAPHRREENPASKPLRTMERRRPLHHPDARR